MGRLLSSCNLSGFHSTRPSRLSKKVHRETTLVHALTLGPRLLLLSRPFSTLSSRAELDMDSSVNGVLHRRGGATVLIARSVSRTVDVTSQIVVLSPEPTVVHGVIPIYFSLRGHAPVTSEGTPRFGSCFGLV